MSAQTQLSMIVGAAGMFGLAIYQFSQGSLPGGINSVLTALGILHVHGRVTDLLKSVSDDGPLLRK